MSTPQGIPAVDLSDFLSGDSDRKKQFVADLGRAYEEIGFVALKNHTVSTELIDKIYDLNADFFTLPEETKKKYEPSGMGGQRGYTSFGKEHAKGRTTGDLKEFWHFGQFVEDDEKRKAEYPENINVTELPEYLHTGKATYQALENDAVRAGEHEDINLITLLVGASADGLQVLNKQGEWKSVTAIEDHIVVNVGDMLQRLTNNKLRSTTHRVVNPPASNMGTSRYSLPFFLHPVSEMPLNCLPETINETHPKQFTDITAGEYLTERLIEIGLK
jgi:isopenicillin N synthase-like dioxygenase